MGYEGRFCSQSKYKNDLIILYTFYEQDCFCDRMSIPDVWSELPEGVSMPEWRIVRSSNGILPVYGRLDGRDVRITLNSLLNVIEIETKFPHIDVTSHVALGNTE